MKVSVKCHFKETEKRAIEKKREEQTDVMSDVNSLLSLRSVYKHAFFGLGRLLDVRSGAALFQRGIDLLKSSLHAFSRSFRGENLRDMISGAKSHRFPIVLMLIGRTHQRSGVLHTRVGPERVPLVNRMHVFGTGSSELP